MQALSKLLAEKGIQFDAKNNRVMCIPHIVHIATSHLLKDCFEVKRAAAGRESQDDDDDDYAPPAVVDAQEQTYEDAMDRKPLAILRNLIRAIRASGLRRTAFRDLIHTGVENSLFRDLESGEVIQSLPNVELLLDVRTRWDSTYRMLVRALELRPVSTKSHPYPSLSEIVPGDRLLCGTTR